MGFARGFAGGLTLTFGVAYLATQIHTRSRIAQSTSLRQQNSILENITKPESSSTKLAVEDDLNSTYARAQRLTLSEAAKDRWNAEVTNAVRTLQTTDWDAVRENAEALVVALYRKATGTETAGKIEDSVKGFEKKVESKVENKRADVAASIAEAGGTVAATRGLVRNAVNASIEKGKEVVDKVVGKTEEAKSGIKKVVKDDKSEVQKALAQRYEKPAPMTKDTKQVLAERYKPMDQQDNSNLRGL